MTIKEVIEERLPVSLQIFLKRQWQSLCLYFGFLNQARRFNRNYSCAHPKDLRQVEARVMFLTHQIEKGLSHTNFRYNFGKKVFLELPDLLTWVEHNDEQYESNPVYNESISALHEYMSRHKNANKDI